MWIFTRDGFFSIAANTFCAPGEVAVRSRRREHLEHLMARHGVEAPILVFENADYRYRIQIPKTLWGEILRQEAESLDYGSFKEAMDQSVQDSDYMRAMSATWGAIHKIQMNALPEAEAEGGPHGKG